MKHGILFKTTAASLALSIALSPTVSWSGGWVDDWIQQKNSTSPSYYEGSKRGYYTGGSFSARWPNNNDFLVSASLPKLKSGCGGIDMFMGGAKITGGISNGHY
ncbi:MAG: conjugal transfer protein TraH [Deltaproteobacteria bacterium]